MNNLLAKEFRQNIIRGFRVIRMLNFDPHSNIGAIRVDIAATSACNYRCYFCQAHSSLKQDNVKPEFMSDEILGGLLKELHEMHVRELIFSGNGEQLLSPILREHIIKNRGLFKIELLTNGSNLHAVDAALFNSLKYLTVSLNSGNGASHQLIHGYKGENQFRHIVMEIERLLQFNYASDKIKLNYAITTDNFNEIPAFIDMAIAWNVSFAMRPVSVDFPELLPKELSHEKLELVRIALNHYSAKKNLTNKIKLSLKLAFDACTSAGENIKREGKLYPCYQCFIQGYVTSNGDVLLCCDGGDNPLGNISKENYKTIWQKPKSVELILSGTQMHRTNKPLFSVCYDCPTVQLHSSAFHSIYSKLPLLSFMLKRRLDKTFT